MGGDYEQSHVNDLFFPTGAPGCFSSEANILKKIIISACRNGKIYAYILSAGLIGLMPEPVYPQAEMNFSQFPPLKKPPRISSGRFPKLTLYHQLCSVICVIKFYWK